MKRPSLLLLLLLCARPGSSQTVTVDSITFTQAYPRLWWTSPQRLAQARSQFGNYVPKSWDFFDNAFAYAMSGNVSYASAAINGAISASLAISTSSLSCDQCRWNGEKIILTYDWCHDQLTAAQQALLVSDINRWAIHYDTTTAWGSVTTPGPGNNYFWGYLRNDLEWGIASWGEPGQPTSTSQTFIDSAVIRRWGAFLPYASTGSAHGGIEPEGTEYGRYLGWYPMVPFGTAEQDGRDIFGETNYFKELIYYYLYAVLPAPTSAPGSSSPYPQIFDFSDIEFDNGYSRVIPQNSPSYSPNYPPYYADAMNVLANQYGSLAVGQYARWWLNNINSSLSPWIAGVDAGGTAQDYTAVLPLDYYAPTMGYLYSRNQWGSQATVVQFQLGAPGGVGHYHHDRGTFQIWRNARWDSKEYALYSQSIVGYAGSGTAPDDYTIAHNGILFGGMGEAIAYQYGPPQVLRVESNANYAYAAVDLSKDYRSHRAQYDDPYAGSIVREFLFIKPLETLVTFDRLQPAATTYNGNPNIPLTYLLHMDQQPQITSSNTVSSVNGAQALLITTVLPSTPTYRDIGEWVSGDPVSTKHRLEIEQVAAGGTTNYMLNILQAVDQGGAAVTYQLSQDSVSYTLTLQHPTLGTAVVVFNKGLSSSGGLFGYSSTSPNPALSPLYYGIEPIQFTDTNVVWGPLSAGPPSITRQPSNQTVAAGQTATFSISATGNPVPTEQWQRSNDGGATWNNLSGATSLSYTTPATTSSDNGAQFRCVVSNASGTVTSNAATLTVGVPPSITQQPSSATVNAGQSATFVLTATGTPALSYQWFKNSVSIASATSSSYTTPSSTLADNGTTFYCLVSNAFGSVTSSSATLTVTSGSGGAAPSITQQPSSATVTAGQSATFVVTATGTPTLSYQWFKNSISIASATSSSYTTPSTTLADNGATFYCLVSNAFGSVTSSSATLVVNPANSQSGGSIDSGGGSVIVNLGGFIVTITLPPGAVSSPTSFSVSQPNNLPPPISSGAGEQMLATGLSFDVTMAPYLAPLLNNRLASITASNLPSYDRPLAIAWYDPSGQTWKLLPSGVLEPMGAQTYRAAYGSTNHFSLFQVMQIVPAADLSGARVFPNPFRPSQGHSLITLTNVPADTRVRIFTLLGEKVSELDTDATGTALWDARNATGVPVASGVYFALLECSGQRRIVKMAVQK